MTALERAARAAAYEWYKSDFEHEDAMRHADNEWQDFTGLSRAVLMAVRDPDEVAILDGERAAWDDTNSMPAIRAMPKAWRAMIDAILNEKDTTND